MDELTIDFSQDLDLDVIKTKVLRFLKRASVQHGATAHCVIHQRRVGDKGRAGFSFQTGTIEDLADTVANFVDVHAKEKGTIRFSSATLSISYPRVRPGAKVI
jgi:hypothetical protein